MDVSKKLFEDLEKRGINIKQPIFCLDVGDVVHCIAEYYGDKALNFSGKKIDELILKGSSGSEMIKWDHLIIGAFRMG